jgi:hypothetical protein
MYLRLSLNSIVRTLNTSQIFYRAMSSGNFRVERDTFGELKVPSEKYYGAQVIAFILVLIHYPPLGG